MEIWDEPFQIFPEVAALYEKTERTSWCSIIAEKRLFKTKWEKENPDLALNLSSFILDKVTIFDFEKIVQKAGSKATRSASSTILSVFSGQIENMIVSSADLSNSDKIDGF